MGDEIIAYKYGCIALPGSGIETTCHASLSSPGSTRCFISLGSDGASWWNSSSLRLYRKMGKGVLLSKFLILKGKF